MTTRHEATTTTDHDEIRRWAEERGGRPASVQGTADKGDHAGILRIAFRDDELEEISWDEFFEKFEEANLAFLHQDRTKDDEKSRFFKFVERT